MADQRLLIDDFGDFKMTTPNWKADLLILITCWIFFIRGKWLIDLFSFWKTSAKS